MKVPKKIISALQAEKQFLIATHINPDGDAVGSSLALSAALESMGKETFVYSRDPVPWYYRFMPGYERFTSNLERDVGPDPVLILLDCNSPERAALQARPFRLSIVIDHHETERDFGDIRWVDGNAAATGVMVFSALKSLGITITKDMATNLYTSIAVDTGTFRYSNTTAGVLRAAAELIEAGAEPNVISDYLYETWSQKRFNLLVKTLNTLEIRNRIAVTYVTREMFRKTGTKPEDTENFSNFPRMIDSVAISAFFRELGNNAWKVSLRSKGEFNVAKIAEQFGGGGHRNAAGYKIEIGLDAAKEALIKAGRKSY